jgi:hypothetical protein
MELNQFSSFSSFLAKARRKFHADDRHLHVSLLNGRLVDLPQDKKDNSYKTSYKSVFDQAGIKSLKKMVICQCPRSENMSGGNRVMAPFILNFGTR